MLDIIVLWGIFMCFSLNVELHPIFARLSAISFPTYPLCPGIQFIDILLFLLASVFRALLHSIIEAAVILVFCKTFMAVEVVVSCNYFHKYSDFFGG